MPHTVITTLLASWDKGISGITAYTPLFCIRSTDSHSD